MNHRAQQAPLAPGDVVFCGLYTRRLKTDPRFVGTYGVRPTEGAGEDLEGGTGIFMFDL